MENWKEVKLGDICDVKSGSTPSRKKSEYFENGKIPWVKTGDLKVKYLSNTNEFITKLGLDNSSAKLFPKGTVLLAMYGATIGACSILTIEAATNQACGALLPSDKIIKEFLFYFLLKHKAKFIQIGVGGAQPNISLGKIKSTKIPLPPLATQQHIVQILDKAQALKANLQAQLSDYEKMGESLFLEMFGNPVVNPKKWEIKRLKNISTKISSGNTPKGGSNVYVEEGIVFFRSQNVWKNKIILKNVAYIDQKTHDKMRKSSLKNGDILMTKTGRVNTENSSLGRAAMFLGEDGSANVNGHVYFIRLKENVINEFVLFILITDQYREYIRRVCVGGIDKRQINKEHLEEFPIISPPIELQQQFAHQFQLLKEEKRILKAQLKEAEALFNKLLQMAFKGELLP